MTEVEQDMDNCNPVRFVLRQGLVVFAVVFVVTAGVVLLNGGAGAAAYLVGTIGYSLLIFLSGATVGTVVQVVGTAILKRTVVANVISGIVAGLIMLVLSFAFLSLSGQMTGDAYSAIFLIMLLALEPVVVAVMYGTGYGRYHRG